MSSDARLTSIVRYERVDGRAPPPSAGAAEKKLTAGKESGEHDLRLERLEEVDRARDVDRH